MVDNLAGLKDDMTAFIEGHGMKRFAGYVSDEVQSVTWEAGDNPDAWKDYVELAKAAGATFLTMNEMVLEKEELDFLIERLRNALHHHRCGRSGILASRNLAVAFALRHAGHEGRGGKTARSDRQPRKNRDLRRLRRGWNRCHRHPEDRDRAVRRRRRLPCAASHPRWLRHER